MFKALHYGDKLHVVDPNGDIGIVTLWTKVTNVVKTLRDLGIPVTAPSRVCAIGNLYGNGLPHLLRNLLWNPQINKIIVLGQNLSGSKEDLLAFFEDGVETVSFLGNDYYRIIGRQRLLDTLVHPSMFYRPLAITVLGKISDEETKSRLIGYFMNIEPQETGEDCPSSIEIPLPVPEVKQYPSNMLAHTVQEPQPLQAWLSLMDKILHFGAKSVLKKGERYELLNVKVVTNAVEDDEAAMLRYGLELEEFRSYQRGILSPELPNGLGYTYGNRLRGWFKETVRADHLGNVLARMPIDSLHEVIDILKNDLESRHAYITLWDGNLDLIERENCPCLVSLFFRKFEDKLCLTATFRTHNAVHGWLKNFWGLMAIQNLVCEAVEIPPGPITTFSQSISISSDAIDQAKYLTSLPRVRQDLVLDSNGEFNITVDAEQRLIIAEHRYKGVHLATFTGVKAAHLERQILDGFAVSDLGHAMYLGRELMRAEYELKNLE